MMKNLKRKLKKQKNKKKNQISFITNMLQINKKNLIDL